MMIMMILLSIFDSSAKDTKELSTNFQVKPAPLVLKNTLEYSAHKD